MITHTTRATDREATFPICVCTPRLRLPPAPRRSHLRRVCDETAAQAQPPQRTGYSPHSTERKLRQDTYTLSATRTPQTSSNSITIITYSCTPTMPLCVPIRGRGGASYLPSTCAKLANSPTPRVSSSTTSPMKLPTFSAIFSAAGAREAVARPATLLLLLGLGVMTSGGCGGPDCMPGVFNTVLPRLREAKHEA